MKSRCCGFGLVTIHDGCLKIIKRCPRCRREYTQGKRRPDRMQGSPDCHWLAPCSDHPVYKVETRDTGGRAT